MGASLYLLTPDEHSGLVARIVHMESRIATIEAKGKIMLESVERLVREVSEQRTVTESVLTFLAGLKEQLAAVQAELEALGTVSETLNSLADDLDEQQQALAAAITTPGNGGGEETVPEE